MLLSAGLEVPDSVFGHGFLTREGQKMGKSLGNVLDPEQLLERCGTDAVRWYLLRDIPFGDDGDFQQQRFTDLVNNDLANTIGNLLNRTSSMARKWFAGCVPPSPDSISPELPQAHPLALAAERTTEVAAAALEAFDFRRGAEAILQLAIEANGYLNDRAPWKLMKQEENRDAVAVDLYAVLETCRLVAVLLTPLLPDLSARMLAQLGLEPIPSGVDVSAVIPAPWFEALRWGGLQGGSPLPEPVPVMQRLELDTPL
jgi:methionyl-tRNA synthetase